jgi:RES domain
MPLARVTVSAGSVWHHIFLDQFPDPLGFGYAESRFSDPRRRIRNRFGVYYVGATFEVAFVEMIVRDRRNGNPGLLPIGASELDAFACVEISVHKPLELVDLHGGNPVVMGLPTDAVRARAHRLGQRASLGIYQRPEAFDGIAYPSRLNGDGNIAVYDRAVGKLSAGPRRKLRECDGLGAVLDAYRVMVV